MTDLSKTIIAKSDQMNADDLAVPVIIKITEVRVTEGDQPTAIYFEGDNDKPYKPCKSMRRILVKAWGPESKDYTGRSIALYNEPTVKWGGQEVGGIRISGVSHIELDFSMPITITRGFKKPYAVKKLDVQEQPPETPEIVTDEAIHAATTAAAMGGKEGFAQWWNSDFGKSCRHIIVGSIMDDVKEAARIFDRAEEEIKRD